MFKKSLIITSVIILLFCGENVLNSIGYGIGKADSPTYQKIFPSVYIVILILVLLFIKHYKVLNKICTTEVRSLIILVILIIYMQIMQLDGALSFIPNTIILPFFISIYMHYSNKSDIKKIRTIIIFFFVLSCSLAIYERITEQLLFPPSYLQDSCYESEFRSSSFNNHPLNNALITSVLISFILISNINVLLKYSLFFLGLLSILSFGTRSSLLIWIGFFLIHFYKEIIRNKGTKTQFITRFIVLTLCILSIFSLIYIILNTSFAERIINNMQYDSSIEARLLVQDLISKASIYDIMFGVPSEKLSILLLNVGLKSSIENFWIEWTLRFGLIFTIIIAFLLFNFFRARTLQYSKYSRYYILLILLILASTNNSLAYNTSVLSIWTLCTYVFKDGMLSQSYNHK